MNIDRQRPELGLVYDGDAILVVDDEPAIRSVVVRVLRRHGYRVLEASNGEDALDIAAMHDGPIRLVVSDVNMPAMNGNALMERLRTWFPGMRFLLISGDATPAVPGGTAAGITEFLAKPFTPSELLASVSRLFEAARQRRSSA
jgi:CheY-like chemotaxis protein